MSEMFRVQLYAELSVYAKVLPDLGRQQLLELRAWLRHPAQAELSIEAPMIRCTWVNLLDATCRRLVDDHGLPAEYFEGVGDMLPEIPADLSELDDSGGDAPGCGG